MRAMIGAALIAALTLLAGCATDTTTASAGAGEPNTLTPHLNGRLNFYTGVGGGT